MSNTPLPLETFACPALYCEQHGQRGQGNVRVRKLYGEGQRQLLKCRTCGTEFSERKGTPLWNTRTPEEKLVSAIEHLTAGNALKTTAKLTKLSRPTVRRLAILTGLHAQGLHDQQAREFQLSALQADERYGFVERKGQQLWEATVIEPKSKFLVQSELGQRNEDLGCRLLLGARQRLANPQDLVLFTDGWAVYESLFPEVFGVAYRPPRQGSQGRFKKIRFRVPRTLAHVLIIKRREGRRVVEVLQRVAHGNWSRVNAEVEQLGYQTPNTSAVERQNGTARRMNAFEVRKSLAFARTLLMRRALSQLCMGVYNWCNEQRGLRVKLSEPQGRRQYQQRTPAMAIGLAPRIWSVADLLRFPISIRLTSH